MWHLCPVLKFHGNHYLYRKAHFVALTVFLVNRQGVFYFIFTNRLLVLHLLVSFLPTFVILLGYVLSPPHIRGKGLLMRMKIAMPKKLSFSFCHRTSCCRPSL